MKKVMLITSVMLFVFVSIAGINDVYGFNIINNSSGTFHVCDYGSVSPYSSDGTACNNCATCFKETLQPMTMGSCPGNNSGCGAPINLIFQFQSDIQAFCSIAVEMPPGPPMDVSIIVNDGSSCPNPYITIEYNQ